MDVAEWRQTEADDEDVFGRYEHASTQTTISIRRGDDWPGSVVVVVTANDNSSILCQKELVPHAVQAATEYMESIQSTCNIDGTDAVCS